MEIHRKFKPCYDSQTTLVLEFMKRKLCAIGITLLGGPTPGSIPNTRLYLSPRTPKSEPKRERKEG